MINGRKMSQPFLENILLASDFSQCSDQAGKLTKILARVFDSKIDIVHVLEFQPGMDQQSPIAKIYLSHCIAEFGEQLKSLKDDLKGKVRDVEFHQRIGSPVDQITQLAVGLNTDLLVMGTHGWGGMDRILLGSTAERVLRGAPCPVMTVRWKHRMEEDDCVGVEEGWATSPSLFLVAIDFSESSLEALGYCFQLAQRCKAKMRLLHVTEPKDYSLDLSVSHHSHYQKRYSEAETRLKDFVHVIEEEGAKADFRVLEGFPSDHILEEAENNLADLIVMGTHGRKGLSRFINGSVAELVLRHAPCPVLTVKGHLYHKYLFEKIFGKATHFGQGFKGSFL